MSDDTTARTTPGETWEYWGGSVWAVTETTKREICRMRLPVVEDDLDEAVDASDREGNLIASAPALREERDRLAAALSQIEEATRPKRVEEWAYPDDIRAPRPTAPRRVYWECNGCDEVGDDAEDIEHAEDCAYRIARDARRGVANGTGEAE